MTKIKEEDLDFFRITCRDCLSPEGAVLYVLTLLILIYIHNNYTLEEIGCYSVLTLILYSVAIGAAEFQLLAYCRFKFPSFYISWEEHERERQEFIKCYQEREKEKNKEISMESTQIKNQKEKQETYIHNFVHSFIHCSHCRSRTNRPTTT